MKKITILKLIILMTVIMGAAQLYAQSDESYEQTSDEGLVIEDDETEIAPTPAPIEDSESEIDD